MSVQTSGTDAPSTAPTVPDGFRTAVTANAAFCGLSGLGIALAAGPLAALLGAGDPAFYRGLGIFLLVYGVYLAIRARRHGLGRAEAWLIIAGDVAWVAGSAVAVAAGILTAAGAAGVTAVAGVVAGFALWQRRALTPGR